MTVLVTGSAGHLGDDQRVRRRVDARAQRDRRLGHRGSDADRQEHLWSLDDGEIRARYETANVQANELLYRRADLEDVVSAHLLALEKAPALGFGR